MKKKLVILALLLMLVSLVAAEEQVITTKTNEKITITYLFSNVEEDSLQQCFPYFTGELRDKAWASLGPVGFGLDPGEEIKVEVVFDRPERGFFQDILQISCDRYYDGEFIERADVVEPGRVPSYSLLVSEAGAGQDFVVKPGTTWEPIIRPGGTETITLTIVNIGSVPLLVDFTESRVTRGSIFVEPDKFSLPIQDLKNVRITYAAPTQYDSLNESFDFVVGDFKETINIMPSARLGIDSLFAGGTFNLFGGDTQLGGIKIPNFILVFAFIGLLAYYFFGMQGNKPYMKKFKKKLKKFKERFI